MKEENKVNLINMLGEDKANLIFKQIEEETKRNKLFEENKKIHETKMTNAMIDKNYLIGGEYYNGHRFRGKHVAMWDGQKKCFIAINYTMGAFFIEELPYFGDIAHTNLDGFLPFERIEQKKI